MCILFIKFYNSALVVPGTMAIRLDELDETPVSVVERLQIRHNYSVENYLFYEYSDVLYYVNSVFKTDINM